MKSSNGIFSRLKKGDFLVLLLVIVVSALLFLSGAFSSQRLRAELYLDGECVSSVNLYELTGSKEASVGNCRILLEKDGVTFIFSACPDKLCVNRGKLKRAGDTMACVPERVTVVLKEINSGVDAVVF